jgi:uncharacterized protein YkuJ
MAKIIDKEMFEGIVNENIELKKQIKQFETKGKTVSKLKYDKLNEVFESFRAKYIENEKYLNTIKTDYLKLSDEHKKILSGTNAVSKSEFDNLVKAIEAEKEKAKQWERLYEQEKAKRNKLVIQTNFDTLTARIKELEEQLIQEQKKHSRKGTGRPRENTIPDTDIVKLREEGKTVRAIADTTKISTATINRILRDSKIQGQGI